MQASLKIGIGVALVIAAIAIYMATSGKKPTPPTPGDQCTATVPCTDTWLDYVTGNEITPPALSICTMGTIEKPYFGPGKCANPCGPNRTPCWDDAKGIGICYPGAGATCPCSKDTDCGGPTQGKCSAGKCVCAPGWSGPTCATKGATCDTTPGACGHGTCEAGACVCDNDGWTDSYVGEVKKPCSACRDGRGPPGSCKLAKYPGVAVPIPIGSDIPGHPGVMQDCILGNQDPQAMCTQYYPGSMPAWLSPPDGTSESICWETSKCPAHKQGGTYALGCMSSNRAGGGIWASPTFDAAHYRPEVPVNCKLVLPDGFGGFF